jgi:hypothetical protein
MESAPVINFFAPLPSINWSMNRESVPETFAVSPSSKMEMCEKALHLDCADRFTYIILGLAVSISILIPLLNLN